jgi:cobalamin biosynthesis protein CobD/CbiB
METGDGWLVTEICLGPLEWLHPVYAIMTAASWKRETVGRVLKSKQSAIGSACLLFNGYSYVYFEK